MADKEYFVESSQSSSTPQIDYRDELNDEQYQVVTEGDGPCLVLAGAGSGKTRTLVYRVAYLLEKGVNPESILLVTFTNKASKEMIERVQELLKGETKGLWAGTFHSIANRILRQYAAVLGYENNFGILDSDDSRKLIKQVYKELGIAKNNFVPKTKVIHSIISFSKNSRKSIEQVIQEKYPYLISEVIPIIERIAQIYDQKKLEANVMDFDDMLSNWLRLLTERQDIAMVLASKFEYVLVDEYQDTNRVQDEIIHHMAQPQGNLLVVGDDAQSIYSFRAATVQNILSFQQRYPNGKLFKLETNYRSSSDILQLANQSIRNNQFQYAKQLKSHHGSAQKPVLAPCKDQRQQAEVIAQRILELRDEGKMLDDIAILFRSSFQIIELELELNRRGVPYIVRGGLRFFEQAHIKDVLAYIKLLQNPRDEVSWRRVLGIYPGVGPATQTKIWNKLKEFSTLSEMINALASVSVRGKAKGSMGMLQRLLLKLMEIKENIVGSAVHIVLEQGYQLYMEQTFDDAKDRLEDLSQLAIFAQNYSSLEEFLSEASLSEGFKTSGGATQAEDLGESLVLSTIHQAKGLEWDVVFGLSLAEGQFPHYRTLEQPEQMEEERRLFYVLVTRTKNQLYITYPIMSRTAGMGETLNRPSQFVREVDEDLFETWQVTQMPGSYRRSTMEIDSSTGSEDGLIYVDDDPSPSDNEGTSILDIIKNL